MYVNGVALYDEIIVIHFIITSIYLSSWNVDDICSEEIQYVQSEYIYQRFCIFFLLTG